MNLTRVDQIAKAVLYEGYLLYPYRPSSVKNRQRFNFGVLYPPAYCASQENQEPCGLQVEFLVQGNEETILEVKARFLHLGTKLATAAARVDGGMGLDEATERDVTLCACGLENLLKEHVNHSFDFVAAKKRSSGHVRQYQAIQGSVEISAREVQEGLAKVRVVVRNTTATDETMTGRGEALLHSLVSTHVVVGVMGGEFVSLLEPPTEFREAAGECENVGVWPVLVGEAGQKDTLLASPIILYDYPQIAPESPGDLFDGTEIDEILSLRILTLTDEEKREIRQSDERARQILDRTESMPAEQFMKLHGAVRGLRTLKEKAS